MVVILNHRCQCFYAFSSSLFSITCNMFFFVFHTYKWLLFIVNFLYVHFLSFKFLLVWHYFHSPLQWLNRCNGGFFLIFAHSGMLPLRLLLFFQFYYLFFTLSKSVCSTFAISFGISYISFLIALNSFISSSISSSGIPRSSAFFSDIVGDLILFYFFNNNMFCLFTVLQI